MSQDEGHVTPKFDARRYIEKAVEIEFPQLPKEARDAIVESRLRRAKAAAQQISQTKKSDDPAESLRDSKKDLFRGK